MKRQHQVDDDVTYEYSHLLHIVHVTGLLNEQIYANNLTQIRKLWRHLKGELHIIDGTRGMSSYNIFVRFLTTQRTAKFAPAMSLIVSLIKCPFILVHEDE